MFRAEISEGLLGMFPIRQLAARTLTWLAVISIPVQKLSSDSSG